MKLAVVGDPVAHSASPALFREFFDGVGIAGTYDAIRVCAGEGARRFAALRDDGYAGLNVTTPLKDEAFAAASELDAVARAARSVNVLVLGTTLRGYNTDGAGAVGALAAAGLAPLDGRRILVLGAGPTARAASVATRAAGARVDLWNRTAQRALALTRTLGVAPFEPTAAYDAVLAALPPGIGPADLGVDVVDAIRRASVVIDANYGARSTLGANLARDDVHDGAEMLRASARESFAIFRSTAITR